MQKFKEYFLTEMKIPDFQQKLVELKELGFTIKPGKIAGIDVVLITAHISIDWTPDTLIFRSSIWTMDGELVSPGYKKFFNFGERPGVTPPPQSLKDTVMMDKMDGSCIIISKYHGELIVRTRGTFDARTTMENGTELVELLKKFPKLTNNELLNGEEYTIIVEWLSPTNVIVINYGKDPDFVLTGVIRHQNYSYMSQQQLDQYAKEWDIKRPTYYNFGNIDDMLKGVKDLKGKEGLCLYYNNHQNILKVKSAEYLAKHAFKGNLTPENLVDIYISWGMPDYQTFINRVESEFDYECMVMAQGLISKIIDAKKNADKIVEHMKSFVLPLANIPRKEAADTILQAYGKTSRSGMAFMLLDNKPLKKDDWKRLILQYLK